jgi:flavorubredoxin
VAFVLGDRPLDVMVINHMEPDHAATLGELILRYPDVKIICTAKAAMFMQQYEFDTADRVDIVKEGDTRCFGKHTVTFVIAPMVHWPEVMVTYDVTDGILFSADAFGSFKALDGKLFNDEVDYDRNWIDENRRYYTNIVGKYGPQVQKLLGKASGLDIKMICPVHGLIWRSDFAYLLDKYQKWSTYEPEEQAVMVAYASMYGHTESAANIIAQKLVERGVTNVVMYDVSKTDKSQLISETFRVSHVILASVTYNLGIFPPMHDFLMDMKALNLQNRTVALIENGTWACKVGALMRKELESMKKMNVLEADVTMTSTLKNETEMDALADTIAADMKK